MKAGNCRLVPSCSLALHQQTRQDLSRQVNNNRLTAGPARKSSLREGSWKEQKFSNATNPPLISCFRARDVRDEKHDWIVEAVWGNAAPDCTVLRHQSNTIQSSPESTAW